MLPEQPVLHTDPLPIISISGSHREMGRQLGEACRRQVQHSIQNAHQMLEITYDQLLLSWQSAVIQAKKYIPFSQERYPQYVDELMGLAEGANISFEDISVLNAMEAMTTEALHLTKCTSLAVNQERTANGHVLAGHNEDWVPEDEPDIMIIQAKPDDEPPFLAFTYGGLLPNIGFNAYGIAQCCDSVYPVDSRIGIPRIIVSRAVLSARNISEAIGYTLVPWRAAGYNHMLVHESGEIYNIEVTANSFAILYGGLEGYTVHTNHYLDPKTKELESEPDELLHTRVRYSRALRLMRETAQHSFTSLQTILRDHVNLPDSICNHSSQKPNPLDRGKTICSLIIDLSTREMQFAWGSPCVNQYHTYYLDA